MKKENFFPAFDFVKERRAPLRLFFLKQTDKKISFTGPFHRRRSRSKGVHRLWDDERDEPIIEESMIGLHRKK